MDYVELVCKVEPAEPGNEIIIAELAELGFESFVEEEDGLKAYIPKKSYDNEVINKLNKLDFGDAISFTFETSSIADQNWNTEWEKNFTPLFIRDVCYIRAPFHPAKPDVKYEIVIEPKMSFGTGHHATTALMINEMMSVEMKNGSILDMGCGTGILAILASKMGASKVKAIDIEEWAYKNAIENVDKNDARNVSIFRGGVEQIGDDEFEVILANINRNVLLEQISHYNKALLKGGTLLVSGFLLEDEELIRKCATSFGLRFVLNSTEKNWVVARFEKE